MACRCAGGAPMYACCCAAGSAASHTMLLAPAAAAGAAGCGAATAWPAAVRAAAPPPWPPQAPRPLPQRAVPNAPAGPPGQRAAGLRQPLRPAAASAGAQAACSPPAQSCHRGAWGGQTGGQLAASAGLLLPLQLLYQPPPLLRLPHPGQSRVLQLPIQGVHARGASSRQAAKA